MLLINRLNETQSVISKILVFFFYFIHFLQCVAALSLYNFSPNLTIYLVFFFILLVFKVSYVLEESRVLIKSALVAKDLLPFPLNLIYRFNKTTSIVFFFSIFPLIQKDWFS